MSTPSRCACSNISLIQLFHELKQRYPAVPDYVVSDTISKYCHDKASCVEHLEKESKAYINHSYAVIASAAKNINQQLLKKPVQCTNSKVTKEFAGLECKNVSFDNSPELEKEFGKEVNYLKKQSTCVNNPITINLDKCQPSYGCDNTSDDDFSGSNSDRCKLLKGELLFNQNDPETLKKVEKQLNEQKLKRPSTLEITPCKTFAEIFIEDPLRPREKEVIRSPELSPLNRYDVSVNFNCHMDVIPASRTFLKEDCYPLSNRTYTSVNLTIHTPISAIQSPERSLRMGESMPGFESHLTLTVSPNGSKDCTPSSTHSPFVETRKDVKAAFVEPPKVAENSLIARQKSRFRLLEDELSLEKTRLDKLTRDTNILASPLPAPMIIQKLRDDVASLREYCNQLAEQLDCQGSTVDRNQEYNRSQDENPTWKCEICTLINHGLLRNCEGCNMPRIELESRNINDQRSAERIDPFVVVSMDSGVGNDRQMNRACV